MSLSKVFQTDTTAASGNALQACVASIFCLPLCVLSFTHNPNPNPNSLTLTLTLALTLTLTLPNTPFNSRTKNTSSILCFVRLYFNPFFFHFSEKRFPILFKMKGVTNEGFRSGVSNKDFNSHFWKWPWAATGNCRFRASLMALTGTGMGFSAF
jgi:hypothetical protein